LAGTPGELKSPLKSPLQLLKGLIGSPVAPVTLNSGTKDGDGHDGKKEFLGSHEERIAVEMLSGGAFLGLNHLNPMQLASIRPLATMSSLHGQSLMSNLHAAALAGQHHQPLPMPKPLSGARGKKRGRDDLQKAKKETPKAKAPKQEKNQMDRFFWTNELHNLFLEAIFRLGLGLMQERPMELYALFEESGGSGSASFTVDELTAQCAKLHGNADKAIKVLHAQIIIAHRHAPLRTNINEKKGGHPAFHVYPFPYGETLTAYGDFTVRENLVGSEVPEYNRRFLAAVFDLGLQCARPKSIFNMMQPTPDKMTTASVKSHLQKYRINSKSTREMFVSHFRQKSSGVTSNVTSTATELAAAAALLSR
jgi:SHAQKYF class myb-like DNA-binding protein